MRLRIVGGPLGKVPIHIAIHSGKIGIKRYSLLGLEACAPCIAILSVDHIALTTYVFVLFHIFQDVAQD